MEMNKLSLYKSHCCKTWKIDSLKKTKHLQQKIRRIDSALRPVRGSGKRETSKVNLNQRLAITMFL